jgi:nitroimidazol reductase NimA-like FMN-containing flavoprotein (pyridoxamine 5'-phosphate oxidase superfamily)
MSTPLAATRLKGPWDGAAVAAFLAEEHSPLRLAVPWSNGVPLVVSVWFHFENDALWCASLATSRLIRALHAAPRVGFEVSVNEVPYRGVRGQAEVTLVPAEGRTRLEILLDRYLRGRESGLAKWLLSRADDEVAIRLRPEWLTSWDYTRRMEDGAEG